MVQTRLRIVVLAVFGLLFCATMASFAETVEVVFDHSLTNDTGWTYSGNFAYVDSQSAFGFRSNDGCVTSPEMEFSITGATVTVWKASDSTQREFFVMPVAEWGDRVDLVRKLDFGRAKTNICCSWRKEDAVTRIRFGMSGSSGNVYMKTAAISGEPYVSVPTDVEVESVAGNCMRVAWRRSRGAAWYEIEVDDLVYECERGEIVSSVDFSSLTNKSQNAVSASGAFLKGNPGWSGTLLYAAGSSTNVLQISTGKERGELVCSGSLIDEDTTVRMVAAKYDNAEEYPVMPIAWRKDGETNVFARVALASDMATNCVSLAEVPAGAEIAFNDSDGAKNGNRRVLVSRLELMRGYAPEGVATNLVRIARGGDSCRRDLMRGIKANRRYGFRIRGVDAKGRRSGWSEWTESVSSEGSIGSVVRVR